MPDLPPPKRLPHVGPVRPEGQGPAVGYVELHCRTNFSFLEGASHADELMAQAAALGHAAVAITDRNSLAGVVRAHVAAKEAGVKLLIGAEVTPVDAGPILLWAPAHILPGVLAVSALERAGGLVGLEGTAKHYWMPLVLGGALIVALATWVIRRTRGGNAIEPARARVRQKSQRRPHEGGDP